MIRLFSHISIKQLAPVFIFFISTRLCAQVLPEEPAKDTITPMPSYEERAKKWGPNDTIMVGAIWYQREMLAYNEEPMVWISKLSGKKLAKYQEEWTRLRNAVYVTYPFARTAGATINDINTHVAKLSKM